MTAELDLRLYQQMLAIRTFEETVLAEFKRGVFSGTTHTYSGQEANAVGVLSQAGPEDIVFSNHRCHGHFLAYGGSPLALFAEMMGKPAGVCAGRGGSQHLHWRNFFSNGVLGGTIPLATGAALAEKYKRSSAVAVAFLGDGALGEGVVYESLNIASLWGAPILFVLEHNHIAQTTPTGLALAGDIAARFTAFNIPVERLDTSDVLEILPAAAELLDGVRQSQAPRALILETERFNPHSKGDDTRPQEYLDRIRRERDPLLLHAPRLAPADLTACQQAITAHIASAFQQALASPAYEGCY
jgi:TPP-dependent pyruvate/acetoin dehydrogenase alpha subunit